MKKASITEAKNHLSALIDGLKGGSSVLIVDRGRPVARLEPVTMGCGSEKTGGCRGLSAKVSCGRAALRYLKHSSPIALRVQNAVRQQ